MHALRLGIPQSRHSLRQLATLLGPGNLHGELRFLPGARCSTAPAPISSARVALSADWALSAAMSGKHDADAVAEGAAKQARTENGRAASADALRVKRLSDKATLPARGSAGAAGYDLSSAEDTVVPARGKAIVKTDLQIGIPEGTYARIAPRSGLAAKHSIDVGAGVVDYDYRGNVGVILFNLSDTDFKISIGDRIAQLILERIATPPVQEVEDLDSTERGAGGFGSTGIAAK